MFKGQIYIIKVWHARGPFSHSYTLFIYHLWWVNGVHSIVIKVVGRESKRHYIWASTHSSNLVIVHFDQTLSTHLLSLYRGGQRIFAREGQESDSNNLSGSNSLASQPVLVEDICWILNNLIIHLRNLSN